MSGIIDTLVEMGFPKHRAELALSKTNATNVEDAMEWLLTHEEEQEAEPTQPPPAADPTPVSAPEPEKMQTDEASNPAAPENLETSDNQESSDNLVARSIRCDDCGKLFKNNTEVEFHASKSGHENFSESTEEKRPLTEEEKREQLAKIEAKLKQRRLEREARERVDELEREKNRIRSGKEILEAKKKHEDAEMKKLIEQRRREKEEDRLAKQRVREQIEQDKQQRKAKFGTAGPPEPTPVPVPTPTPPKATTSNKNFSEAKLQIRLTNGATLTHTFGAKEPLSAVKCFIEMNRTDEPGPFALMTPFPRKIFLDEDYDKPLCVLDLAPSAVLIVSKAS